MRSRGCLQRASTGANATPVWLPATGGATLGADIDHPVGLGDGVEVMLSHDHAAVARIGGSNTIFLASQLGGEATTNRTQREPVQVLSPPTCERDVLAAQHDPIFFTFVNPERAKGAEIGARLAGCSSP